MKLVTGFRSVIRLWGLGLLALLLGLPAAVSAAPSEVAAPFWIEQGIHYEVTGLDPLEFTVTVDRDLLPPSMRGFTKIGAIPSTSPPTLTGSYLRQEGSKFVNDYQEGGKKFIFRTAFPMPYLVLILADKDKQPLGYTYSRDLRELMKQEQQPPAFSDVPDDHWAAPFIRAMAKNKWVEGYADGLFHPDAIVSRAEFAKIMVQAAGLTAPSVKTTSFADVGATDWHAPYVEAAKPYLTGYAEPGGKILYKPNEPALREDIAIGIVKLKRKQVEERDPEALAAKFSDFHRVSGVARKYVGAAVEEGWMEGFPDGTFRPEQPITRAQAAALLGRAFGTEGRPAGNEPKPAPPKEVRLSQQIIRSMTGANRILYTPDSSGRVEIHADLKGLSQPFEMTYMLDGQFEKLTATLAVRQYVYAEKASAVFEFVGDGRVLKQAAGITSAQEVPVEVDLTGVNMLLIRFTPDSYNNSGLIAVLKQASVFRAEAP